MTGLYQRTVAKQIPVSSYLQQSVTISIALFVSFCAFSWPFAALAAPFSFDDIKYWVGTGSNRAALIIDWADDSAEPPALVWGYRWDGAARGSDMLMAVVAADPRLVAKLGGTPANPNAVFGLGFDTDNDNNDENFKLAERDDMGQVVAVTMPFDEHGFFYTGPADGEEALDDADDFYAEGWFTGFWHYGVETPAGANPYDTGSWSDIGFGMALRALTDGAWDSWAFTPTFNFDAFAENPTAALPPFRPGDFNTDGRVDAADYNVWRSAFGSMSAPEADANGNGTVDAADYVVWRKNVDPQASSSESIVVSTPEPATFAGALLSLFLCVLFLFRKRRENVSCTNC